MFPAASVVDLSHYDFLSKDNDCKWKGIFIPGLKKVSKQVGVSNGRDEAFEHVERLILQLLGLICARPSPHNVAEIEERIQKMLPPPMDKWAIDEASNSLTKNKKKSEVVFPVDKIHSLLQKEVFQHKIDHNVAVYISAVLEYISADILQWVGNYVKRSRHAEFTVQDVKAAMCCDKVLCDLFKLGDKPTVVSIVEESSSRSVSYTEVVDDFLHSERQYLRDLQMLLKVFRDDMVVHFKEVNKMLESTFLCIEDLSELSMTLISSIEDTLEMNEPNQTPAIGACLLELAENWEFDAYDKYSETFNPNIQKKLTELLNKPDIEGTLSTAGHGFSEAVKFYFPKLLLEPFYQCTQYFEYIKLLYVLSTSETDKADLQQTEGVLTRLKAMLESINIPIKSTSELSARISGKGTKQIAQQKVEDIQSLVEGFHDSFGQSYFNEFFCEGELQKVGSGKKMSERYGYLFDGFMLLCKPCYRRTSVVSGGPQHEFKLKEAFYLEKVEAKDKEDIDDWKNLFEIHPREQTPIILSTRTFEEKANWMGVLVMLTSKSMLDRILDKILSDQEKKHPLRLPSEEKYRFAVPDSDQNIVLDRDNGNHSVIKGATLLKLIERLTHHQYSDPNFVNTFLTTFRSFCYPHELLDLLIERFNVPDPDFSVEEEESFHAREMLKRFRKEYARHIRLRVLNVMKQWVIHHFYDFERDPFLQTRLEDFLDKADESKGKSSIFESVRRFLKKAVENSRYEVDRSISAVKSPPPVEYHIKCPVSEWSILTIHPIEFARQLTLLEFDYYRVVKPSELVGSVWTKKDKDRQSPNLLRMIKHTTNVTRWFERTIVDAENLEERVAIVSRILEVMIVLQDLNNFNAVLAVVSAMGSASVHRLSFTFQGVSPRLLKALEDAQELQSDHYKKYQERLRSINPPCVPFFGMYLSNILHIEEGNRDFLPNSTDLINFAKRRKVAEITSEIRQFQYSHYVLAVENRIREFIASLQPFEPETTENEISNYLYEKSLEIEPRGAKQPIKASRKWPDLNLKSPGIKPSHLRGRSHPGPLLPFSSSSSLSSSRMTLDDFDTQSLMSESICQTPKTLTPSSLPSTCSPSHAGHNDFAIFAPVLIGSLPSSSPNVTSPGSVSYNTTLSQLPGLNQIPPPLPPRRKLDGSIGDSLSPRVNDAPEIPPPLPPRKVSPRTPNPPLPSRRNSSAVGEEVRSPYSPSVNQPPLLSPMRLTPNHNGSFQISQPSTNTTSGFQNVSQGHGSIRSAFEFNERMVPYRTEVPQSPPVNLGLSLAPKLPPKGNRPQKTP